MKNTIIILSAFSLLVILSCKDVDKKTMNEGEAQTLLNEAAIAYSIYAGTQEEATRAGLQVEDFLSKSAQAPNAVYPQISIDPSGLTFPKTITLDYGPDNLNGVDGHQRRGIIIIEADNFPDVEGAIWDITFSDYYQDDNKVEGSQTIKYLGKNANDHPEYQSFVTDGMITTPNNKVFYFEQETTREWIAGYDTHYLLTGNLTDLCDDKYEITGSHWGTSSDGYSYSMSSGEPLIVGVCCQWVEDGVLNVSLDDYDLSCEIDYKPAGDDGGCNNQASFSIFGANIPINLP